MNSHGSQHGRKNVVSGKASRIGVIGLGYVGLPLAVSFAKKFDVIGFDINELRVKELAAGHDRTLEVAEEELRKPLSA